MALFVSISLKKKTYTVLPDILRQLNALLQLKGKDIYAAKCCEEAVDAIRTYACFTRV